MDKNELWLLYIKVSYYTLKTILAELIHLNVQNDFEIKSWIQQYFLNMTVKNTK